MPPAGQRQCLRLEVVHYNSQQSIVVYLARRDVESTGAQVYSLPLVNEGQHKDDTGALWRTHSTQTKHYYPLVVRHSLGTK